MQHATYMPEFKWNSRTEGQKADALIEFNNQGDLP